MRRINCRISRLQWLLIATLCANFMVLCYLAFLQDRLSNGQDDAKIGHIVDSLLHKDHEMESPSESKHSVTIVLREFEDFENSVVETLQQLSVQFPQIPIVVISDSLPYPPLKLPITVPNLRLVTLKVEPNMPLSESRPDTFIKSNFVVIIPDGVKFKDADALTYMLEFYSKQSEEVKIVAWPIGHHSNLQCQSMSVNLKEWKIEYGIVAQMCDSIQGNSVIFLSQRHFFSFSNPFVKPTRDSIFIQSALRGWKSVIGDKVLFEQSQELYSNPHFAWKHKKEEQNRLKDLYKEFGIKLVKQDDGTERFYGCTKETSRCFGTVVDDMPEYIHHGRWTPPCCLETLRKTARHVFRILESQGVRFWLEGGSLLGAARHGDIIPWDYDVDIGMYKEDITKSYHLQNAAGQAFEDDDEFIWTKADPQEGDFFRVHYSQSNHMHVDIFPFYSKNGTMTKHTWMKSHRQDCEFPEKLLLPLNTMNFAGGSAPVPYHMNEFLELKFGAGVIENPKYPNGNAPN